MDKLKIILSLLRSNSYILLTDKAAVMNMPLVNIDSFHSTVLLVGQNTALIQMRDKLNEAIEEHNEAISLAERREHLHTEKQKTARRENKASGKKAKTRNTK